MRVKILFNVKQGTTSGFELFFFDARYNKLTAATASTKQTIGAAGEKTSAALKSFGSATAKKWQDIRYIFILQSQNGCNRLQVLSGHATTRFPQ